MERFLQSQDELEVTRIACELRNDRDPRLIPILIRTLLQDAWEPRRYAASLAICFKHDGRLVSPLIAVVRNAAGIHSIRTRCMSAEALGYIHKRKAIDCLIDATRDPSPDVRFWSVFALGKFLNRRRRGREVERALLARLEDREPLGTEHLGGYWPVNLEALAMLAGAGSERRRNRLRSWREHDERFSVTTSRLANQPDILPEEKRWLECYT